MAKKKNLQNNIIKAYMNYVLENNQHPPSVYHFSKDHDFSEAEFYDHFGSFQSIEKTIFTSFFDHTLDLLTKNQEYQTFDAQNQLLSFYYTFFEVLKANRSYVLMALNNGKPNLAALGILHGLREVYKKYVDDLDIPTIKQKGLTEISWQQLLFTMNFWIGDSSTGFEKTDIFIEKSIKTSFELIDITPLKSLIDLGKFFIKEKITGKN
jgi:hypothetical protein